MKRNKLTENWGLKIASMLFAIAVWLVVVNINDPSTAASFYNVPVTIENADVIAAQGKIYEIENNSDVVPKVTVYGPRSVLENIDKSDIVAVADMNNLSSVNTINIEFSTVNNNGQVTEIKGSTESVKVSIENKKTVQLVLDTRITGSAPSGYTVGNVSTDQNLVRVSGPETLVNQVKKAVVNVDMDTLSGVTSDITTSASVHLYNAANKEITGSTLLKNPDSVIVTVGIEPTKEVPLVFKTSGTPADGYVMTGKISAAPEKIMISGSKSTLDSIKEIDIPEEALNVTGQSSDMTTEIDISEYLPANVSLVNNKTNGKSSVIVYIEKQITRQITVNASDIKVTNLPANETCVLEGIPDQINLSVTGGQAVVNAIAAGSVAKEFDVNSWMKSQNITDLQPGTYAVQLSFNLPEGVTLSTPVAATLAVTRNVAADAAGNTKTN